MLTTTTAFDNTVKNASVEAKARVIIHRSWSHLADTVTASDAVTSDGSLDDELFPIESIVRFAPPKTGIPFGIVGEASVYDDESTDVHFRVSSDDMPYTHWIPVGVSDNTGALDTPANPSLTFDKAYTSNKLEARFDITAGKPSVVNVYTKATAGGSWTQVATNQAPDSDGVLELWYDGSAWTTTYDIDNTVDVAGVRFEVTQLDTADIHAQVISIDAGYVKDVTDDIITLAVSKSREEQSPHSPAGLMQTNVLELTLDDTTEQNSTLPLERNTKITVELGYDTTSAGGTAIDVVPAGTFYIDAFNTDEVGAVVSVSASDLSRQFQENFSSDTLIIGRSLRFIVNDLLRRSGYTDMSFRFSDTANVNRTYEYPYVWWSGDESLWDILTDIVRAEQGAFYMNESNEIEIVDYDHLSLAASSSFTFDDNDIININRDYSIEANDIDIIYNVYAESYAKAPKTIITPDSDGGFESVVAELVPVTQILWSPAETVALGSATLYADIDAVSDTPPIRIEWASREQIPFDKGEVKIEGEYFSYDGKTENTGVYVELQTTARALRGSSRAAHLKDTTGWVKEQAAQTGFGGTYTEVMNFSDGKMHLQLTETGGGSTAYVNWLKAYHPNTNYSGTNYNIWGTKFKLRAHEPGVQVHNMGGLYLQHNDSDHSGYYFEVVGLELVKESNFSIGTLRFYKSNGDFTSREGLPDTEEGIRGYFFPVAEDMTIQLEVVQDLDTPGRYLVYANGIFVEDFTDNTYLPYERFGVYVRGNSYAEFEYLYAGSTTTNPDITASRHKNSIGGGYLSGWVHDNYDSIDYYTEFQPDVREVRTFDVDYNIYPAVNGLLFNVNDVESRVVQSSFTPFRAKVTIENISHESAVLNGEDADLVEGHLIEVILAIYGRVVILDRQDTINVKDKASIRKRGRHSITVESPWIQSEDRANTIAEHIKDNWSDPVDFVSLECVPNPALQPGDIVTISWTERGYDNEEYYIISSDISFDGGFTGTMLLRKR